MELTQDYVCHLLDYRDGQLFWKHPKQGRKLGYPVGCKSRGYLCAMIDGTLYRVHRLIFLHQHGYIPVEIDHRDGNGENNRIENLRPATSSENKWNRGTNKNNTSGYKGVTWDKRRSKWVAQIVIDRKHKALGQFDNAKEAHEAYKEAAALYFGEFVRAA